jgi:TatD DNase family protein
MFVDTHCHINAMVKELDAPLTSEQLADVPAIITAAHKADVLKIVNVGTSLIESKNCVLLAQQFDSCYAAIGIHPNDATEQWAAELKQMRELWFHTAGSLAEYKIVGVGECGIDRHYPGYNLARQQDAFKAQIELALEYNLPLIVHTRDAAQETLTVMDIYRKDGMRGIIHCFSEGHDFAHEVHTNFGFYLGIGGTVTYPKNVILREVVNAYLNAIVLETDAPFLPPQQLRGKKNTPAYIPLIAQFIAELTQQSVERIAELTTQNAHHLFNFTT